VVVERLAAHRVAAPGPPGLLLGYAAVAEPGLREAARRLAEAVRAAGQAGSERGS
jgi:DNA-binding transcriptional MocR family regulator